MIREVTAEEIRATPRSRYVRDAMRQLDWALARLQDDGGALAEAAVKELQAARGHMMAALAKAIEHDVGTERLG